MMISLFLTDGCMNLGIGTRISEGAGHRRIGGLYAGTTVRVIYLHIPGGGQRQPEVEGFSKWERFCKWEWFGKGELFGKGEGLSEGEWFGKGEGLSEGELFGKG